ncbi:hypothetical protein AVEN_19399-1 [Araneus ventricosus]|uniref:Uncharacterized protein n=1 Tax=Araneus ventricosus TaxID=182803 RepID=A0A4Y2C978_ARAVE|nr:hypothetical protein AVEN_19399-1 [Araneus ventricosus]
MAKDIFFVSVGCLHLSYTAVKVYEAFNGDLPSLFSITGCVSNIFKAEKIDMKQVTKRDSDEKRKDDLRLHITHSMITNSNKHEFDENLIKTIVFQGNFMKFSLQSEVIVRRMILSFVQIASSVTEHPLPPAMREVKTNQTSTVHPASSSVHPFLWKVSFHQFNIQLRLLFSPSTPNELVTALVVLS